MKFLVIRFSSIGDIVWTTPVLRILKQQFPNAQIHFVTKKNYASLLENNPYIDKMYLFDNNLADLVGKWRTENYDYVIDLHANLRSAWVKWKLQCKSLTYNKHRWAKWFLVQFKINRVPQKHIVTWYIDALKPLGIVNDGKGLDFFIPEHAVVSLQTLPATHQTGYVAIVIGASEYTKKLPLEQLITLVKGINKPIVLIGGGEDAPQGEAIIQALPALPILNGCGKYSLMQSASVVQQASFVVGHDTGMTHIAAALRKKVYGIYGGTLSQYLYPYGTDYTIIENNDLACRPCSKAGLSKCPKGHFKCMRDLSFQAIFDEKMTNLL